MSPSSMPVVAPMCASAISGNRSWIKRPGMSVNSSSVASMFKFSSQPASGIAYPESLLREPPVEAFIRRLFAPIATVRRQRSLPQSGFVTDVHAYGEGLARLSDHDLLARARQLSVLARRQGLEGSSVA